MASEIRDTRKAEASKSAETGATLTISDPPVMLAGPKTTSTPRTSKAPRGKIFEDAARGTVFWEVAESSDDEQEEDGADAEHKASKEEASKWGNPFRIEWIKWLALLKCR